MSQNNEFRIEDEMIMEYYGNGGEIIIPEGVTDIFFQVFCGMDIITSVIIPGTILEITPFVFESCSSLKKVTLNEGVNIIGVNSFNCCEKLEIVNLPKSLKNIKLGAFVNCISLKEIRYAGSKEEWDNIIKEEAWNENSKNYDMFFNCKKFN